MLHILFWLIRRLLLLLFNFFLCTLIIFLACALVHIFKLKESSFFLFFFPLSFLFIFLFFPFWVNFFVIIICSAYMLYSFSPKDSLKINAVKLFIQSLKILIKLRETIFISDKNYFRIKALKYYITFSFLLVLVLLFASFYQLTVFFSVLSCLLTAILLGLSLRFFSSLISFPFYNPYFSSPPGLITSRPSSHQFAIFLKDKINSHPLNAIVEERFYEDNLQIGDFFVSYPLFFKASSLNSPFSSTEDEIMNLWHTIRWESAFSKQTGSAASRWSSLYGINSSIPARAHSVHTPLIPVFRSEIFEEIKKNKLPVFDPFNQPPEWSPYFIAISFLNWTDDEIKEERLSEIEEED